LCRVHLLAIVPNLRQQEEKLETILNCPAILRKQKIRFAANEKGLAFVGELEFRQPITKAQ